MLGGASLFVTGGTGFLGRALLRYWLTLFGEGAAVPSVTILSRSTQAFLGRYPEFQDQPWLRFHTGDILDPETLPKGQNLTYVLHAAADSTLGPQIAPLLRYDQIVDGTRNMLNFALASGALRFLFISTGGVYGPQPSDIESIPEDYHGMPDPLNPANAYSVAKRVAEHLCALYQNQHGLATVIARCFAFVGPDLPLDVHFAIGNFIRDALTSEAITVDGDGSPLRTYLDQADLAHWLVTLLERGKAGEAYNVGSDEVVRIAELAHLVRNLLAPDKPVHILSAAIDTACRNRYVPDIRKAWEELGLRVTIPLVEAIRRTGMVHGWKAVSSS